MSVCPLAQGRAPERQVTEALPRSGLGGTTPATSHPSRCPSTGQPPRRRPCPSVLLGAGPWRSPGYLRTSGQQRLLSSSSLSSSYRACMGSSLASAHPLSGDRLNQELKKSGPTRTEPPPARGPEGTASQETSGSGQDGDVGRHTMPPRTTKRRTTTT